MKIYADENIETSVIDGLRRRGITLYSAVELGYRGKSDKFHLAKAGELDAIVLTHDVDFLVSGAPSRRSRRLPLITRPPGTDYSRIFTRG